MGLWQFEADYLFLATILIIPVFLITFNHKEKRGCLNCRQLKKFGSFIFKVTADTQKSLVFQIFKRIVLV
jgi:hypothetical protein